MTPNYTNDKGHEIKNHDKFGNKIIKICIFTLDSTKPIFYDFNNLNFNIVA